MKYIKSNNYFYLRTERRILLLGFVMFFLTNCGVSKKFVNFDEVKNGKNLEKAKEVEINEFLPIWIENTTMTKRTSVLEELYRDTVFTYFGKYNSKSQIFIKISNLRIDYFEYKSIIGDSIRTKFLSEVIPLKDQMKVSACEDASSNSKKFSYRYLESNNSIEIKCHYKFNCSFFIKTIDKIYSAFYDIKTKKLTKIE